MIPPRRLLRFGFALACAQALASPAEAQRVGTGCGAGGDATAVGLSGVAAEFARMAEIRGDVDNESRALLRHADSRMRMSGCAVESPAIAWRLEPVRFDGVSNSGYDVDRNNGAMWSGRGASTLVRLGGSVRWRGLALTLAPEIVYHANRAFDTPAAPSNLSEWAYPLYGGRIDLPQRFGDEAGTRMTAGQSALTLEGWGIAGGVSTENLWGGPARRYPILLSNTAEGLHHVFLGTRGAPDVWIGRLSGRVVWGRTRESDYFDADESNDWTNLVAWGVSLRPRGLDWLEVGALRTYHYQAESSLDLNLEPVIGFLTPTQGNRVGDELASLFMRVVLPESHAEFYGEWARTDRFADVTNDVITEPDHSQAYMVGFQKLTEAGTGWLRLHGELVHLQEKSESRLAAGRPLPVFYTNGQLRQGHTNGGQLLGAWVGPGADAQFAGADLIGANASHVGVFLERVRRNQARAVEQREVYPFLHDVEWIAGLRAGTTRGSVTIAAAAAYHRRLHRMFASGVEENIRLEVELGWWPEAAPAF